MSDSRAEHALTPAAFEILVSLADVERYGYAIMREVNERTAGRVRLRAGTLYRAVDRMLRSGWLEELGERPAPDQDDQRRRYYRLTDAGRRVLRDEVARLEAALAAARQTQLLSTSGR